MNAQETPPDRGANASRGAPGKEARTATDGPAAPGRAAEAASASGHLEARGRSVLERPPKAPSAHPPAETGQAQAGEPRTENLDFTKAPAEDAWSDIDDLAATPGTTAGLAEIELLKPPAGAAADVPAAGSFDGLDAGRDLTGLDDDFAVFDLGDLNSQEIWGFKEMAPVEAGEPETPPATAEPVEETAQPPTSAGEAAPTTAARSQKESQPSEEQAARTSRRRPSSASPRADKTEPVAHPSPGVPSPAGEGTRPTPAAPVAPRKAQEPGSSDADTVQSAPEDAGSSAGQGKTIPAAAAVDRGTGTSGTGAASPVPPAAANRTGGVGSPPRPVLDQEAATQPAPGSSPPMTASPQSAPSAGLAPETVRVLEDLKRLGVAGAGQVLTTSGASAPPGSAATGPPAATDRRGGAQAPAWTAPPPRAPQPVAAEPARVSPAETPHPDGRPSRLKRVGRPLASLLLTLDRPFADLSPQVKDFVGQIAVSMLATTAFLLTLHYFGLLPQ